MKSNNQPGHNSANRQKRRFVRIEVFSPVSFNSVVVEPDKRVRLHPEKKSGVLLNLSGGGVLVSTTDHVTEGEFLLMKFDVHGFDALTNVIGKVKRVERCEDGEILMGVEFLAVEQIDDPVIAHGLARMADHPKEFSQGLSRLISRYVFQRQIEIETE
ncbi:MAG TPA: PilZ domain-containing protein [bacterium]|nr:PilZ domain-containing protein [bacterium]